MDFTTFSADAPNVDGSLSNFGFEVDGTAWDFYGLFSIGTIGREPYVKRSPCSVSLFTMSERFLSSRGFLFT